MVPGQTTVHPSLQFGVCAHIQPLSPMRTDETGRIVTGKRCLLHMHEGSSVDRISSLHGIQYVGKCGKRGGRWIIQARTTVGHALQARCALCHNTPTGEIGRPNPATG